MKNGFRILVSFYFLASCHFFILPSFIISLIILDPALDVISDVWYTIFSMKIFFGEASYKPRDIPVRRPPPLPTWLVTVYDVFFQLA